MKKYEAIIYDIDGTLYSEIENVVDKHHDKHHKEKLI